MHARRKSETQASGAKQLTSYFTACYGATPPYITVTVTRDFDSELRAACYRPGGPGPQGPAETQRPQVLFAHVVYLAYGTDYGVGLIELDVLGALRGEYLLGIRGEL